jgi:pimeloyl-ACP methyl ester carboxylesterase
MTTIDIETRHVNVEGLDVWVERRGAGPDVLLLGGLTDPVESWEPQLSGLSDRYCVTAFDNPGAGRTPVPEGEFTVTLMADIAAGVMRTFGIPYAHVAGFSGGSFIGQELALRHPDLVRSLVLQSTVTGSDAYFDTLIDAWRWLATSAPSERAMLEAFFLWIYTARAHNDGTVAQIVEEALAFPYPQSAEDFVAQLEAFTSYDAYERLPAISAPTLVLAGAEDIAAPPRLGKIVADRIAGARFHVMDGEAHQPFQEVPETWNAIVDAFWHEVAEADGRV